jgi:hypothetical protein
MKYAFVMQTLPVVAVALAFFFAEEAVGGQTVIYADGQLSNY